MAQSAKVIKTKIASVKNIGKITRAMELVSVAKMRPAVDRSAASREYAERALEIIENLSRHNALKHYLMKGGKTDKTLVVLISSNKGLCGSYNANVLKSFASLAKEARQGGLGLIAVGKYSERGLKHDGVEKLAIFSGKDSEPKWTDAKEIADFLMSEFGTGNYRRAILVYTRYESPVSYRPVIQPMLPISLSEAAEFQSTIGNMSKSQPQSEKEPMDEYLLEPSEDEILNAVLPRLVESQVYQALLEARASEHSARMFAMKNASDNAKTFIDDLTLSYNQARQSAITSEISEIAAGADAL